MMRPGDIVHWKEFNYWRETVVVSRTLYRLTELLDCPNYHAEYIDSILLTLESVPQLYHTRMDCLASDVTLTSVCPHSKYAPVAAAFITARRYAFRGLSVRPSVRLSVTLVDWSTWFDLQSRFLHHDSSFWGHHVHPKIRRGHPERRR